LSLCRVPAQGASRGFVTRPFDSSPGLSRGFSLRIPPHGLARGTPLVLTLLCGLLAGCSTFAPQIQPPGPQILKEPPAAGWTTDKLLQILDQRDRQFRSVRALASVSYRGPEGRQGFQEAIVVQRPDRARLETLSMLGAILIVTVNADQIAGFHPRESVFIRGESTKENLFRYTRIPLELEEMTRLLVGLPPVAPGSDWQTAGGSLYRDRGGQGKEIVTFDLPSGVPVRWHRLAADGSPELSAAFENYSSTPAGLFPSKIIFESASQKRTVEIVYEAPEINAALPAELFSQQKPANAKELPIEALGS
jgi:hypothetical protein